MRKLLLLILILAPAFLTAQTKSVLFLGNSYTAANNLPDLVYQLALSGGDTIQYDSNTPGGYTLQLHSQDVNSLTKINQQPWDYVVLQAQSQEPSLDTPYVVANVFPYARMLDSLIHVNDSCTQTVFYMTWGRKNGDASNCAAYPPVCTYQGMQDQLRNRYLQMGYDNGAAVAPCGEAWRDVIATTPAFDLYIADESHPSLYGSYLNACVFYATIYRRSPVGLPYYAGLPAVDAQFLQLYAANCVLDSMQLWNTEVYYDNPDFTQLLTSGSTYTFTANTSATGHQWNFGNGFVAGTANETFTFPGTGTYLVSHVTDNGCHTDTASAWITVGPQGIAENDVNALHAYPQPADESLTIGNPFSSGEAVVIEMYDALGKRVMQQEMQGASFTVATADLPSGLYTVQLRQQEQVRSQRLTIQH